MNYRNTVKRQKLSDSGVPCEEAAGCRSVSPSHRPTLLFVGPWGAGGCLGQRRDLVIDRLDWCKTLFPAHDFPVLHLILITRMPKYAPHKMAIKEFPLKVCLEELLYLTTQMPQTSPEWINAMPPIPEYASGCVWQDRQSDEKLLGNYRSVWPTATFGERCAYSSRVVGVPCC